MALSFEPMVSVVMVIRDVESFVAEAIDSILTQTFRDFEFIIVDFGSRDKSKEIASEYARNDERIRLVEIPACSYIEAKIAACLLPTGRYIAIQDADDVSFPNRLEAEVEFMARHPELGLLGGAVELIDSQGKYLRTPGQYPTEDAEIRSALKEYNPFWHPTVLILREAYVRAGGYRAPSSPSDDYDLWLRISEHYQSANLKQLVLKYRIHPAQLSLRKRRQQILCALAAQASASLRSSGREDLMNSVTEITPDVLEKMGVSEAAQKKALAEGYASLIKLAYAAGENAAVLEASAEMFELCHGAAVDKRLLSDVRILAAKAFWNEGRLASGFLSAGRAVLAYPRVMARPLKPLRRLLSSI